LVEAREHQEAVLEASQRILGAEHPDTLGARSNLAVTLYTQGDLAAAREHQQAVLEAMQRNLGAEHPDTLTARNNLAVTLKA
jgi:Tetratricopeptide repeat